MKFFVASALIGACIGGAIVAFAAPKSSNKFIDIRGPRIILKSSRTQNCILDQ